MVLLYLLGTFVLLLVVITIRNRMLFYKKETCSICGKQAGEKNNGRYSLIDGCMCHLCANEYGYISPLNPARPNAFANKHVSEVQKRVSRKAEIGDAAFKEELEKERRKNFEEAQARAKALAKAKAEAPVKCPKCGSTQISANKKGVSAGKAIAGAVIAGGVGLLAGALGSNEVIITCLKCGHKWRAGKK